MLDKQHHIDQFFQEQLSQQKVAPLTTSWDNLEKIMDSKKNPVKHSTIYFQVLRVAAMVLFVLLPQAFLWQGDSIETNQGYEIGKNTPVTIDNNNSATIASASETEQTEVVETLSEAPLKQGKETSENSVQNIAQLTDEGATPTQQPTIANDLLQISPIQQIEMIEIAQLTIVPNLMAIPSISQPSNDVKVVINLSALESPSDKDSEKPKTRLGKFWQKIKELPIGESDD